MARAAGTDPGKYPERITMNSRHPEEARDYRIYAMLLRAEETYFFIGKTSAKRISAVFSRHRTGCVKVTEGYFDQAEAPELYLLEELPMTRREAYRHVVAWCSLFYRAGYVGINHTGTLAQAMDLLPATKAIADTLSTEPLDQILERTWLPHPANADRVSDRPAAVPKTESVQMNIRLQKQDKARFDAFCHSTSLNQREGFTLLLDRTMQSAEFPHLRNLLLERDRKINALEQENEQQKAQLAYWTEFRKSPGELAKEKQMQFFQDGLKQYLQLLFPNEKGRSVLPETSYRKYTKRCPLKERPQYPEADGFLVLRLEALLWGRSRRRAAFLIGTGVDGIRYQLRCYPKADHIGLFPRSTSYAFPGAYWYAGCQRSTDGAMDLIAAFPLDIGAAASAKPEEPQRKESLDTLIHRAECTPRY